MMLGVILKRRVNVNVMCIAKEQEIVVMRTKGDFSI